uniref:Uncharacterized protein n=1 Tax=Arion vulgaris TaxID=1028688 RepID=A0A0B7BUC4_9EUPU
MDNSLLHVACPLQNIRLITNNMKDSQSLINSPAASIVMFFNVILSLSSWSSPV